MINVANLIWICPLCMMIGAALILLVINDGGYPDD